MLSFEDAQENKKENPATFDAPSKQELEDIKVGDNVKVCIGGERFWNVVTEVNENEVKAIINNDLVCTDKHGYSLDDVIEFEMRNIYSILK